MARFPFVKPLETFDAYQPSRSTSARSDAGELPLHRARDNVIVLRPPGVGKTHLAVVAGASKAIEAGYRVLFVSGTVDRDLDQGAG